jgi:hypothetical protein
MTRVNPHRRVPGAAMSQHLSGSDLRPEPSLCGLTKGGVEFG